MAPLRRATPLTPLDALRALVREGEGDASFQTRLPQTLQTLKKQALPVLGSALAQATTPRPVKRTLLNLVSRFDWAEWVPHLLQALLKEPDLGVFDEGCAALGHIGTRSAWEALETLRKARSEADRQVILARELGAFQSPHPMGHHLARLQEGGGNHRLAQAAAKILSLQAGEGELGALAEILRDGDEVSQRLSLRLLAQIPGSRITAYLVGLLGDTRQEHQDNQDLAGVLRRTQGVARAGLREEFLQMAARRFTGRSPAVATLAEVSDKGEEIEAGPLLEPLQAVANGHADAFLLGALGLLLEGKVARYSALHSETEVATGAREDRLLALLEQTGEALALRVDLGWAACEEVLPALESVFLEGLGGDGCLQALMRLVPPGNTGVLEAVLAEPDMVRRQKAMDALGAREDDALASFFLRACQDPIVEVGQRAMHHLGKLPSSEKTLFELFSSGHPDQMRRAIRTFGENRTVAAASRLLDFISRDQRDDLLVDAVDALAEIRMPEAAPRLLDLLHDGKPLNLQLSLAAALGNLERPEASLGLLAKAPALKHPQVLILCLEGALSAFPAFHAPLPITHLPEFLTLLDRCFDDREGQGQRMRAIQAVQHLYILDHRAYDQLKERFSDALFEMRTKETWDREANDRVAEIVKEMTRRSEVLAGLAHKEADIQSRMASLPPTGPKRVEALLALRDALGAPGLILRSELAERLGALVLAGLARPEAEWREIAHLCEIGGHTRVTALVDPIREVFQQATGLGLKSAAKEALLKLGLPEAELLKRSPVRTLLVLEPSAFFRKRLVAALAATGRWEIREAGDRHEAQTLLGQAPVDLLITELHDAEGDLGSWLEAQHQARRMRSILLSVSTRDLGALGEVSWLRATFFKPYPQEMLLAALEV